MKATFRAVILGAMAALALATTGCTARTILAFEDHPTYPVTGMQVFRTDNYWLWATSEHQFWTCTDTGNQLVCKRACGGKLDIECPNAIANGYGSGTNVR